MIHQYSIKVKLNLITFKNYYLKFKLVKDYYFKNYSYESKMNYFCQSKESENIENISMITHQKSLKHLFKKIHNGNGSWQV